MSFVPHARGTLSLAFLYVFAQAVAISFALEINIVSVMVDSTVRTAAQNEDILENWSDLPWLAEKMVDFGFAREGVQGIVTKLHRE